MQPTTLMTRATVGTAIALLASSAAACSSTSIRGAGTVATAPGPTSRPAASAAPGGGVRHGTLRGLLLMIDRPAGATIEAIDPNTGSMTGERTFDIPSGMRANEITFGRTVGGLGIRSAFDASLDLVAAEGLQEPDGSVPAGVLDSRGHFTALTPPTKGYSSPKTYVPLGFDPGGRLWYTQQVDGAYTGGFSSVDPARGAASTRIERVSPNVLHAPDGGLSGEAFWIGSEGPVDASAPLVDLYLPLPGGTAVAERLDGHTATCPDGSTPWGWYVGTVGQPVTQAPLVPATNGCVTPEPQPAWPLAHDRFLTVQGNAGGDLGGAPQIYDNRITNGAVRATALLPQSNRAVTDVVADPAGTTVAFISTVGSTKTIYTVPLRGGDPHPVLSLPDDPQADYTLFDWR